MNGRLRVLVACAAAAGASACGDEPDELHTWLDTVKARPGAPIDALPRLKPAEHFVYDPAGRRSPFVPAVPQPVDSRASGGASGPDPDRPRGFLEGYSLDALRMVGLVSSDLATFALVQTPDGLVHRLSTGNYMGRHHGRVVGISERAIQLVETVANENGGFEQRPATIALVD